MQKGEKRIAKKIADYLGYSSTTVRSAMEGHAKPLVMAEVEKCLERYANTGKVHINTEDEVSSLKQTAAIKKYIARCQNLLQKAKARDLGIDIES